MSLTAKIAEMHKLKSGEEGSLEFTRIIQQVLANDGKFSNAALAAGRTAKEGNTLTPRVKGILQASGGGDNISRQLLSQKAAVGSLSLSGSPLTDYAALAQGFVNSLVNSAFQQILPSMVPVALRPFSGGAVTSNATGYLVSELYMKPISKLSLSGSQVNPQKSTVAVTISAELAKTPGINTTRFIQTQLQAALAIAVDSGFIQSVTSGISTITSSGSSGEAVLADISALLQSVGTGQNSKLFFITTSAMAKVLSVIATTTTSGLRAFPDMTPQGGLLCGIPCLVSDAVITGQLILVDATGLAGATGDLIIQQFENGIVQSDTVPDSPPTANTVMRSLWQFNEVAIVLEMYYVAARLRSDACAIIQTTNGYVGGFSPP